MMTRGCLIRLLDWGEVIYDNLTSSPGRRRRSGLDVGGAPGRGAGGDAAGRETGIHVGDGRTSQGCEGFPHGKLLDDSPLDLAACETRNCTGYSIALNKNMSSA